MTTSAHNFKTASAIKRGIAFIIDWIILGGVLLAFLFVAMGTPKNELKNDEGKPSLSDKYQFFAYVDLIFNNGKPIENTGKLIKNFTWQSATAFLLLPWIFFAFFEAKFGGSIGKLVTRCRVKRKDGGKATLSTTSIRFLAKMVNLLLSTYIILLVFSKVDNSVPAKVVLGLLLFISIMLAIQLILIAIDRKKQAMHDKIANTMVINK